MNSGKKNPIPFLKSLSAKYIIVIVIILSVTMSGEAYLEYKSQKGQFTEQLISKGMMLGNFVALVSPEAILGYDFVLMDQYMKEITLRQDVVYSVIISPKNINITTYTNQQNTYIANINSENLIEIVNQLSTNGNIIKLEFPITEGNDVYGKLLLGLSTDRISHISRNALEARLIHGGVIICILSIFLIYVFRAIALRPIHELIKISHHVASGDLDQKAKVMARDELGTLAESFNNMTASLKASYQALSLKNKELVAATKAKSVFLANVSHEIRTPLTAIIGFGESLLDSSASAAEKIASINTIIRNGNHLHKIINDILDLSKIEAGKLEIELVEASPVAILKDIEDLVTMQARSKNLDFEVQFIFPLPNHILTDPLRLKQILINLTGNALKFTHNGKITVEVSCDFNAETISFAIRDTGIGLSPEQQKTIFAPFSQADVSTTRQYGGTGLGLPLSQQLSVMLGGGIGVKSRLHGGSQFTATISTGSLKGVKLIESLYELPGPEDFQNEGLRPHDINGKILLAEDEIETQKLIGLYISKTQANLTIVENGKLAIDAALHGNFDLILMDMHMPVVNGCDAAEFLRNKGNITPILALSAEASEQEKIRYSCAGCDGFIAKPIVREELFNKLVSFLPYSQSTSRDNYRQKHPAYFAANSIHSTKTNPEEIKLGGKVLLAEDTADNQRLIRMYIRKIGPELTIVENGKHAVKEALKHNYDLILMDMQMPVMGGLEAIRILKEKGYKKPIVAITANALKHDREIYEQVGCDAFIAKPINRKVFVETLAKFLPANVSNQSEKILDKPTNKSDPRKIPDNLLMQPIIDGDYYSQSETKFAPFDLSAMRHAIAVLNKFYQHLVAEQAMSSREYITAQQENKKILNNKRDKSAKISVAVNTNNPIVCQLDIDDPDLQKTVEGFLDGLPAAQKLINRLHDKMAWEDLKTQIHQVKGTGGAFGFPQLTDAAKNIYKALNNNQYEQINPLIENLNTIYNRIYAGRKVA